MSERSHRISPLVRINLAPVEAISTLHGIGPELAERIVKYRDGHGLFGGPEDLARVEGVGLSLATTLSLHIDWQQTTPSVLLKDRNWFIVSVAVATSAAGAWMLNERVLPGLVWSLDQHALGEPSAKVGILIGGSMLALFLCCLSSLFLICLGSLTRSRQKEQRLVRLSVYMGCGMIMALLLVGLGNVAKFQFYSEIGWQAYLDDMPRVTGTVGGIISAFFFVPLGLILWRPQLIYKPGLSRLVDVWFVVVAPFMAWSIWVYRSLLTWWVLSLAALLGILFCYFGIKMIRGGQSLLVQYAKLLGVFDSERRRLQKAPWLAWLNARMPDPEDQKSLKEALEKAYPPSKMRTVAASVVIVAGGWLLVTTIGAVLGWVVQGWLDHLIP